VAEVRQAAGQPARAQVSRRVAMWLTGSAVGAVIIALPDSDHRVFSLSRAHGPSVVDLLGVLVVVLTWVPVATLLVSSRRRLTGRVARIAAVLAVVGLIWLVLTLAADLAAAWAVGVVLLTVAQLLALGALWAGDRP
jgi:hypothetical protein